MKKLNPIFNSLNESIKFLKDYSSPKYKATNKYNDIKLIVNSIASYQMLKLKKNTILLKILRYEFSHLVLYFLLVLSGLFLQDSLCKNFFLMIFL